MYNDLVEEVVDFDLYRVFYIVKKNGSFSKAAEEMNTTQPAISYKVKKLEENDRITRSKSWYGRCI